MSIIKKLVSKMAVTGEIERDVTLPDGSVLTLRPLSPSQTSAAYGLVSIDVLRKVNGDKESKLMYQQDTIERTRTIALIAFAIKKVDDNEVMERDLSRSEELEERKEMFMDLLDMEENVLDLLSVEYNELNVSRRKFFSDGIKNAEK